MNGGYNHNSWSSDHNLGAWQLICTCKPLAAPHDLLIATCNLSCQLPRKVSGEAAGKVASHWGKSPPPVHLLLPFCTEAALATSGTPTYPSWALSWLPHSPPHIPMCPSPSLAALLWALHFMTALLNRSSSPNCHHELRTTCTVC